MHRVIFFTTLPLWSLGKKQGGPAFTKTIENYCKSGWDIYLISDEPANQECDLLDREHNILLRQTIFKRYGGLVKIGALFRILDHKIMTRRFYRQAKAILKKHPEKEYEGTVLYAYEIFGVAAGKRLSEETGLPLVTRFQGTILAPYENTFINRLARYPHFQALEQHADLIIMTDDGTQGDRVLQRLGNTGKTLFFRNGLDLMSRDISAMYASFDRQHFRSGWNAAPDDTVFLTVSRLTGWKKVDRAIRGFADFVKKGGRGKLIIVGDGDARADLESLAHKLNVSDGVVFAGAVAHEDVYSYMMACDVFLSLYDLSNVGNPLLEAMTLGKCIITYDVGDTRRIICHEENGILLNEETLPTLGSVMLELAQNHNHRDTLGKSAAAYAKANFWTWAERMAAEETEICLILSHKRE